MDRGFIKKRLTNLLGESELDDWLTKQILLQIDEEFERILTEEEPRMVFYRQGAVSALRQVLEKARLYNKQRLAQEEQDDEN